MTTTTLVPYNPEPDAGVGLRWHKGWLVSTPSATHVRWLAAWQQAVISNVWNLALGTLRLSFVRSCLGLTVCAVLVFWLALHSPGALFWCWLAGATPFIGAWLEVEPTRVRGVAR